MSRISVMLLIPGAFLLSSCSHGSTGTSIIPPVQAQAGYSNSSISGTYSIVLASPYNNPDGLGYTESIGSFSADGNGNITSGSLTEREAGDTTVCAIAITGTYSLQSSAAGTASVTTKSTLTSGTGPCRPNRSIAFAIAAGQQGATLLFAETDSTALLSGTAVKQ